MKKIFIYLYACDRRGLDANKVRSYLIAANYKIVDKVEAAEIILFFTCAAVESLTKEVLKKIKQFQRYDAELIITGCLPAIEKEKLAEIFDGTTIITKDLEDIKQLFPDKSGNANLITDANIVFRNISINKPIRNIKKIFQKIKWTGEIFLKMRNHILGNLYGEHSLFYRILYENPFFNIRISSGCLGNCSYCGIKKAIGKYKSKPFDQCITEFYDGIEKGYVHFVIDADDTGAYGIDINSSLPELLEKLTQIRGDYKISIRNLHPKWIVTYIDELEHLLKKEKIVSIESAIQSGSNRILKLMRRYDDVQKIKLAYHRLQNAFPKISLTTHYLMGFPTETEDDFNLTMNYLAEVNFSGGFIFPYDHKLGTYAANIEPKISKDQKKNRLRQSKKFLKNAGYDVIYLPRSELFIFENSSYRNG